MQRPGLPAAGDPGERSAAARPAQADPPWLEYWPITLSVVDTSWFARGVAPACCSFLPTLDQLRPRKDISNSERPGPVASEERLVKRMTCRVGTRVPPSDTKTWVWGSAAPKTLPPLKSWRARPSQKLSKLND